MENRKANTVVVNKVLAPKPYDLLADQLREAILGGEIIEGDPLPTERELVEQTGLTRGSVREALKQLAAEGLVQTRPGRFGGNIATLPDKAIIATSLGQYVRGRRLPLRTLHETRDILEPALARLAAFHHTEEDLKAMERWHDELVDSVSDFQKFSRANIKWHNTVAQASHNDMLVAVLESLSYGVSVSTTIDVYDTPATRQEVIRVHSQIMAAIAAKDGEMAERRMHQHICATHARADDVDTTEVPLSSEAG